MPFSKTFAQYHMSQKKAKADVMDCQIDPGKMVRRTKYPFHARKNPNRDPKLHAVKFKQLWKHFNPFSTTLNWAGDWLEQKWAHTGVPWTKSESHWLNEVSHPAPQIHLFLLNWATGCELANGSFTHSCSTWHDERQDVQELGLKALNTGLVCVTQQWPVQHKTQHYFLNQEPQDPDSARQP